MKTPQYLILDNNPLTTYLLIEVLREIKDISYKIFTSPSQLVESIKNCNPDMIFCNVTAQGCDARKLCNNQDINAPLVFFSDLYKHEEKRLCYLKSGYPYITTSELPDQLEQYL